MSLNDENQKKNGKIKRANFGKGKFNSGIETPADYEIEKLLRVQK